MGMPPPGQRHGSESFMSIIEIYLKFKKKILQLLLVTVDKHQSGNNIGKTKDDC